MQSRRLTGHCGSKYYSSNYALVNLRFTGAHRRQSLPIRHPFGKSPTDQEVRGEVQNRDFPNKISGVERNLNKSPRRWRTRHRSGPWGNDRAKLCIVGDAIIRYLWICHRMGFPHYPIIRPKAMRRGLHYSRHWRRLIVAFYSVAYFVFNQMLMNGV